MQYESIETKLVWEVHMKYDFDTVLSRTGTGCIKWDKPFACSDEQAVLPLWVADMDFPCSRKYRRHCIVVWRNRFTDTPAGLMLRTKTV